MGKIFELNFDDKPMQPAKHAALGVKQIVWLNGYGQSKHGHERKAIYKITISPYDGKIIYETINLTTFKKESIPAWSIKHESQIFGIGIYYTSEDFATQEEIDEALINSIDVLKQENQEEIEAVERKKIAMEKLKNDYNFLIETSKKMSSRITATKNIRIELKRNFPGVKFSVTSESYSGGDSIDVTWKDGPTNEEVRKITDNYQEGSFNGMEDIYEYSSSLFCTLFGGSKYVFAQRDLTKERYIKIAAEMGYKIEIDDRFNFVGCDYEQQQRIQRETNKTSFYIKPEITEAEANKNVKDLINNTLGAITVRRNEAKKGIEIIFHKRPERAMLDNLKEHGFRWSRYNKLWYNKDTAKSWEFANSLV